MESEKEGKKLVPPYVPYKTFLNFIERLKAIAVPTKIDRSVVASFSGAMQSQLFTTLKYLNLMNQHGVPTEKLSSLVAAEGDEKKKKLKEILISSYPFLFNEGVNLQRITADELKKLFEKEGALGGTTKKSIIFFIAASKSAGIELSPYLGKIKTSPTPRNIGMKKKKFSGEKPEGNTSTDKEITITNPKSQIWQQTLLSKFPSFDPAWSAEVQAKWFDGFKELMNQFKENSEE